MGFGLKISPSKANEEIPRLATDQTVASLSRPLTPLYIETPISKTIETLRQSNLDAHPVVSGSRLVAMLTERELSNILLNSSEDEQDLLRNQPLSSVLDQILSHSPVPPMVRQSSSIGDALQFFVMNSDVSVAGVTDQFRSYTGVVTRIDLLAYRFKTLAPPRVGGMATPLGVYLTDGVESGGVGNLGLFLAGVTLTSLFVVAMVLSNALDIYGISHHFDVNAVMENWLIRYIPAYAVTLVTSLRTFAPLALMFVFLRFIPVAGYHAAEHQVVHCIERGEPLLPRIVARMPRPHPRCGTNLVSAVFLFGLYYSVLSALMMSATEAVVPAALGTLLTWRQVGTFLQQYFTTRPASEKQLASGIRAGQDLMNKYRRDVNRRANWPLRIWRMGFLQMLAGSSLPGLMLWLLERYVPVVQPYTQGIY